MAHLWTGAPAPAEYIEFVLCRDVYHCRPSELRQEDLADILAHLTCLRVESDVQQIRQG